MRTLKKSPNKARVVNNLGYVYQQAARIDEARNADVRAIGLDPSYWKLHQSRCARE
jgi:Flp pilus assembly protein TadD